MSYKSSHTMGTQEMVDAMVAELPPQFAMRLNREDMEALIRWLAVSLESDEVPACSHEDCANGAQDCMAYRLESLFSSIAETLNIEGV